MTNPPLKQQLLEIAVKSVIIGALGFIAYYLFLTLLAFWMLL